MSRMFTAALAIAVTASMLVVPPAYAWQSGSSGSAPSSSQYRSQPSSSPSSQAPMTERMQRVPAANGTEESAFSATVSGRVTSVDHQSGRLTLDTIDGPLSVRFPPPAILGVSTGDHVTVGFGLVANPQPSASPSTAPAPGSSPSSPPSGSSGSSPSGSPSGWTGSSPR